MKPDLVRDGYEHLGFVLLLGLLTAGVVFVVWPFATSVLWAALAAIMFQPLYRWFFVRLKGRPNRAAVATLLFITFAVLLPALFIGGLIVEQAANVVIAFQEGDLDVAAWFTQILDALPLKLRAQLDTLGWTDFGELQARAQALLTQSAGMIAQQAVAIGGGLFSFVLSFLLGLYVAYFLLRDGRSISQAILRGLPLEYDIAQQLADRFVSIVRATIKGSGVVGLVQGGLGAITFWIVGIEAALLLGLLMAIFSLLPAVGTGIVWVPAAIYLLATGSTWEGIFVTVSGLAVIGMADNLLRPILVGRDTGIPDWIILITTLGGIATMGLSGVVLGPLLAGLFLASWSIAQDYLLHHKTAESQEGEA
ncbi:MAG TPA: AI-2E family transporter [Erythrobacter sp.]|nr:AI-2E family transporter [Erythrobacter sp.]